MRNVKSMLVIGVVLVSGICFAQSISLACKIPLDTVGTAIAFYPGSVGRFYATSIIRALASQTNCSIYEALTNQTANDLYYSYSSNYYYYLVSAGSYMVGSNYYAAGYYYVRDRSGYYWDNVAFGGVITTSGEPYPAHQKKGLAVWHAGTTSDLTYTWCAYHDLSNDRTYLTYSSFNRDLGSTDRVITRISGLRLRTWGPVFVTGYDSTTGDGFVKGFYGYSLGGAGIFCGDSITISGGKAWASAVMRDERITGNIYLFVAAGTEGLIMYRVLNNVYSDTSYNARIDPTPVTQWKPTTYNIDLRDIFVRTTSGNEWWIIVGNYAASPSDPMLIGLDWRPVVTGGGISVWATAPSYGKKVKRIAMDEDNRRVMILYDK